MHPEVGEMSRYQVTHLEHQGMAQQGESCPVYPLRMGPQQPWLPAGARRKTALFFNPYWTSGAGCGYQSQDTHHQLEDWSHA